MTKDEILSMARESGFERLFGDVDWVCLDEDLERFSDLVAEKATEQANARQNASWALMCEKMVTAEREACAKVCDARVFARDGGGNIYKREATASQCALAIRARGQK